MRSLTALGIMGSILVLVSAGCGRPNPVVGKWTSVEHSIGGEASKELVGATIEFRADGTAKTALGEGTYEVKGGDVLFKSKKGVEVTYKLEGGKLTVSTAVVKIVYEKK